MAKSEREGTLYLIEAEDAGAIKVGFTSLPVEKRLRDLQTGCPHNLILLATTPGLKSTERAIHAELEPYRVRGEWFDANALPVQHLVRGAMRHG